MDQDNQNITKESGGISLQASVVLYYLIAMLSVFPLYLSVTLTDSFPFLSLSDGFFSIRHDKYTLFLALTGIAVVAEILLIFTQRSQERQSFLFGEQKFFKLSFTDIAFFAFWFSCAASTLLSEYTDTAIFGEPNGRNNGLLLMTFYFFMYLLVTRLFEEKEVLFKIFAVSSAAVYLLAILNGFHLDPLRTFVYLKEHFIETFTSTIGNIDMMSSYISVSLPVFIVMSAGAQGIKARILYITASSLGFMALLCSGSDSGILGLAVFLMIYTVAYSRNIAKLGRLFLTVTVMLASSRLLLLLSAATNANHKEISDIQTALIYSGKVYILIAVFAAVTAAVCFAGAKKPEIKIPKATPFVLGGVLLAAVAAVLGAFLYFSVFDTETELGSFEKLLRFNERWGTHRGFFWIKSFEIFKGSDILRKLFGTGPDTFFYAFSPYFSELTQYGDTSTSAAHNEYINLLITVGAFGAAAYLTVIISAVVRAIKPAAKSLFTQACIAAVICYSAQAFVNIAQPITTPIFIILLTLCEASARNFRKQKF